MYCVPDKRASKGYGLNLLNAKINAYASLAGVCQFHSLFVKALDANKTGWPRPQLFRNWDSMHPMPVAEASVLTSNRADMLGNVG